MIDKNKVIGSALLILGANTVYNDNKSDEYKIANNLLEVVAEEIIGDDDFLFSSSTVELTSVGINELGENIFNIPIDFLRLIKGEDLRIENEFIYSKNANLIIQYGRKIDVLEYPNYIERLLTLGLAKKLALAFNSYLDRFQMLVQEYETERRNVIYKLGYSRNKWED